METEGKLRLENGILSHGAFGRLFGLTDPEEFETAFRRWASAVVPVLGGDTARRVRQTAHDEVDFIGFDSEARELECARGAQLSAGKTTGSKRHRC